MLEREHAGDRQVPRTDSTASYLRDVLRLPDGRTEEQVDEELKDEARMLGVDVGALAQHKPTQESTDAFSSSLPRRSQESVTSKASRSTGLISNFSDISREQPHLGGRGRSRASLSFRDYDAFLARGESNRKRLMSFSPPITPSQSTFSLPLSSPESSPRRHFRRLRNLSMLRLGRAESSISLNENCPHCPQEASSQRRAIHKLRCGHRLCTQALRNTIKAATDSANGAVPCCCGIPIAGKLVENVMTEDEQSALLEKLEQWDEAVSITPSVTSGRRPSSTSRGSGALARDPRNAIDDSKVDAVAQGPQQDMDKLVEQSDYARLRQSQVQQRDRFLTWIEKQRAELEAHHNQLRRQMMSRHETAVDDLLDAHNVAMSEAEDKQVKAEADMRHAHSQEKRDNATALKHMEAYCAGKYGAGEPHNRTVTEQDIAELEKARRTRDQMDNKHESAINVLRGEQSRRMKFRAQRQEREVQELRRTQGKEEHEFQLVCVQVMQQLDDGAAERRHTIGARWLLQSAIFVKKFESESGIVIRGRLPSVDWAQVNHIDDAANSAAIVAHDCGDDGKAGLSTGFALRGTA